MLAEAGVLNEPTLLMSRGLAGIENETRPNGSWPRKAHPMDERVYSWGWKTQHPAESRRGHGTHQIWCREDRLSSAPFVSMVQAAHLGNGNDTTVLRSIDGSRLRGVFRQG